MNRLNGRGLASVVSRAGGSLKRLGLAALALAGLLCQPTLRAQESTLSLRMIPELTLTAPLGTSNTLQSSGSLSASWTNLAGFYFGSTNPITYVDQRAGAGSQQFYRLVRISQNDSNLPPFSAPTSNLVWIVPGTFVMGSASWDPDRSSVEEPQTTVTLSSGYWMGQFEVTQDEFASVVGSNPSQFGGDGQRPVDNVRWIDATNFCRLLNIREASAGRLPVGWSYRLPTEAEWEYAARAGSTNRFSHGFDTNFVSVGLYAWHSGNSGNTTHPVGEKLPNAWGLYDMSGNVCEWVQNWFETHPGGAITDPKGPSTGLTKVFRGGAYDDGAADLRPAARRELTPDIALSLFGLRVVLAPTP